MTTGDLNWRALTQLGPGTLALAFGLLGFNYLAGGIRLTWLGALSASSISLGQGVRAYFLGLLSAAVTPGGSGNTPAVALSLRQSGLTSSKAWSVALYLAILDLFFMAWSIPLSLVLLTRNTGLLGDAALWLAPLTLVACLGLWFVLSYRLEWLRRVTHLLFRLRWLRRWHRRALAFHSELARGAALMARRPLWIHVPLALLTTVQHASNYLIFYVVASALGSVPLGSTLAAAHVSTFASYAAPVPGGSGFLEVAVTTLTRERSVVVPAVVTWRLISFYSRFLLTPFFGGALLAARKKNRPPADGDEVTED